MKATVVFGSTLAAIIAINWAVDRLDKRDAAPPEAGGDEIYPDATFRKVSILTTDKNGIPTYRMNAEIIRHFTDGTTELMQPVLLVETKDSKRPWRIVAKKGVTDENSKEAILKGEVTIDREGSQTEDPVHLVSKDITIDYDNSFAHTDAITTMESGDHSVSGKGMNLWFERPGRIRLLEKVKGRHVFQ